MSTWVGTWDVEQKAIVGTFTMEMVVWEEDGTHGVEFHSEKVTAQITDVQVDGDSLNINVDLAKPLKAEAVMELGLTGPDRFGGVGRVKFLPNSTYTGVRRGTAAR